jgi:tagaturonate reductase
MKLPLLKKNLITSPALQSATRAALPGPEIFNLPEKVLQFGAGGFLRAFADYFIDNANRRNIFNGRIVVVQSTGGSRGNTLQEQDGLFTLCVQGLENGAQIENYAVISSISRTLSANEEWPQVLQCAANPHLELILSNTTEVGIAFDEHDALAHDPPHSFPGKLTAFLHERFKIFSGAADKGLIIIPCELVDNNADLLLEIILKLSKQWQLGEAFTQWLTQANRFCNSLVDRIVPGTPANEVLQQHWQKLGYEDRLLTCAEVYSLWAIQGDETIRQRLAFPAVNPTIIVANDITPYRERKVRILNGTHTLTVPAAFLLGNRIVLDNMNHPLTSKFIARLIFDEIVPSLDVDRASAVAFAHEVLERWRNPFLQHKLIDITLHSTSKMRARNAPTILRYYQKMKKTPRLIAFGFAAYLLFMRGVEKEGDKIFGRRGEELYPINDDQAGYFFGQWRAVEANAPQALENFVSTVCGNENLWGAPLAALPGFAEAVSENLFLMLQEDVHTAMQRRMIVSE